jgi:hypothetical protein
LYLNEKLRWLMVINSAKLIARQLLPNGLTLEFWDHSRPVAGDRWYVLLEARIAVPVRADTLPPDLRPQAAQVVAVLGDEIIFSQKDERNFIAASEAPGVLKDMQERFMALAPGYFGHTDFAAKFIPKKYAELRQQHPWLQSAT